MPSKSSFAHFLLIPVSATERHVPKRKIFINHKYHAFGYIMTYTTQLLQYLFTSLVYYPPDYNKLKWNELDLQISYNLPFEAQWFHTYHLL
jgi:hypothetical protein